MRRESIATAIGGISAAAALFSLSSQSCGNTGDGFGGSGGITFQPPHLEISAPRSGACITASVGDEPYVPISVEIEHLQLAPPGVCSQQLTTVSSTGTGFGGSGGSGGNQGFTLPCGHLALFACTMATAKANDGHCPFGAPPNNESSGTTIDFYVARLGDGYDHEPTNPVDKDPTRLLHIDVLVTREARSLFELVDAETPISVKPIEDLRVLPPGFSCPETVSGNGGSGGESGNGGMGGIGGKH